jgi:hypothetical protein
MTSVQRGHAPESDWAWEKYLRTVSRPATNRLTNYDDKIRYERTYKYMRLRYLIT